MINRESILRQIRENLEKHDIDAYYPTQHVGECLKEYVVISYDGAAEILEVSSVADLYSIMCYVPKNKYSTLINLSEHVRNEMRNIFPVVRETGTVTPSVYDEEANAHMVSLQYVNYRKIKHRK